MTTYMVAFVRGPNSSWAVRMSPWLADVRASLQTADGDLSACYVSTDGTQGFVVCESPDAMTAILAVQQSLPVDAFQALHAVSVVRCDE
jgi:hypothetical protein